MNSNRFKILMVDDDPNVLSAYRRTFGRNYTVTCAEGGAAALAMIETEGPFAVVVTDMRMPGMNGLEFIQSSREKCKESVFLMLTGNGDQHTAVDAINTGQIFRFLTKPCPQDLLESSIRAAIRQYEIVTAERVLLRDTLTGSIKLMVDALELADPHLGAAQTTVKQLVHDLCAHFRIAYDWQFMVASSVCLIGLVGIQRSRSYAVPSERALVGAALLGSQLVVNIPRMSSVSAILAQQREPAMLPATMQNLSKENLEKVAACFIRAAVDLSFSYRAGLSHAAAVHSLAASGEYDTRLIEALAEIPSPQQDTEKWATHEIRLSDIKAGMVLSHDLNRADGTLLLSKNQPVSELAAANLRSLALTGTVANVILVRVRAVQLAA